MAVVVITGASSGIGEATARELGARGHRLVLAARRVERLEALARELAGRTEVLVVPTDVADPGSMESLAAKAGEHFGHIDVWINNAGMGREPWYQQSPETIRQVIGVNLTGPILGARAALPWLQKTGRGHIINIGSVAGYIGTTGVYSATKFGLRGWSEAMRREFAPLGIKVSYVAPGFIRTEMTEGLRLPMPGPELVARAVERLIRRPRRAVVVPGWYRIGILLDRAFPWLADWILISAKKGGGYGPGI